MVWMKKFLKKIIKIINRIFRNTNKKIINNINSHRIVL